MALHGPHGVVRAGRVKTAGRWEGWPNPPLISPDEGDNGAAGSTHERLDPLCWRAMVSDRRIMSSLSLARTCRRGCLLRSLLARSSMSTPAARPNLSTKTSRAMRRTRLRVVALPAVLPSATISRPPPSGAVSPHAVHGPALTRMPRRRRRPTGVSVDRLPIISPT